MWTAKLKTLYHIELVWIAVLLYNIRMTQSLI